MTDEALAWRVEQACFNAWPSIRQVHFDDWCARYGGGLTRRINSANPLRIRPEGLERRLEDVEAVYHRWSLTPRFRIPSLLPVAIDDVLAARAYVFEAESLTLFAPMGVARRSADPEVEVLPSASPQWLTDKARLSEHSVEGDETFRRVLSLLSLPAGFAILRDQGAAAAVAFGVVCDGLLCVEAVVTDAQKRGRGFGSRMLAALFDWAGSQGAKGVCLQVQGDNEAGKALYRSLGLRTELYRYHYRRQPALASG
jgi:ribosomal protein S18 acetylase RimI-like enzyme